MEVGEGRNWGTYAIVSILNIFNKKIRNKTKHKILLFNIHSVVTEAQKIVMCTMSSNLYCRTRI